MQELYALIFPREHFTSNMACVESEFDVQKDLPQVLLSVLDRTEECISSNDRARN